MKILLQDPQYSDSWLCLCGNTACSDGFYPCNSKGEELEPNIGGEWDEISCVCFRCGRIIDQRTLEIIGVAVDNKLTEAEKMQIFAQ